MQKGLVFYSIGAFLRSFEIKTTKKYLVLFSVIVLWMIETFIVTEIAKYGIAEPTQKNLFFFFLFRTCETAISPFCSALLFLFFLSIDVGSSKLINTIAATTFGVYLIHDSKVLRKLIWHNIFEVDTKLYLSDWFPVYMLIIPLIVFSACSFIDYLRILFVVPCINKYFDVCKKKIQSFMFSNA